MLWLAEPFRKDIKFDRQHRRLIEYKIKALGYHIKYFTKR